MANFEKLKISKLLRASVFAFVPFFLFANPQLDTLDDVESDIEKLIQLEEAAEEAEKRTTAPTDEKPKPPEICVFPVCE